VNFEFLAAARMEFEEAFDYYEAQREALGEEFAREVYTTIQPILDHPLAWTKTLKTNQTVQDQPL
jgi:plasmid stabilization system protein ParE